MVGAPVGGMLRLAIRLNSRLPSAVQTALGNAQSRSALISIATFSFECGVTETAHIRPSLPTALTLDTAPTGDCQDMVPQGVGCCGDPLAEVDAE